MLLEIPLAQQREYTTLNRTLLVTEAAQHTLVHHKRQEQKRIQQIKELDNDVQTARGVGRETLKTRLESDRATPTWSCKLCGLRPKTKTFKILTAYYPSIPS